MRILGVALAVLLVGAGAAAVVTAEQVWAPPPGPSSPPVLVYWQNASYGYTATLAPSALYNNSTTITNLSGPLFIPITLTVNFTLTYTFAASGLAQVNLGGFLRVLLVSPTWTRPLADRPIAEAVATATSVTIKVLYDLDVPDIVALISAIENETGTEGSPVNLLVAPAFGGTVNASGVTGSVGFTPTLDLSFTSSAITLGPLQASQEAALADPALVGGGGPSLALVVALASLAALLAAAGVVGISWARERTEATARTLESRVRPYADAVADTLNTPANSELVVLQDWDDIVKVADTLGKPILRYRGPSSGDRPAVFFVRDGAVCYTYRAPVPPPSTAPKAKR